MKEKKQQSNKDIHGNEIKKQAKNSNNETSKKDPNSNLTSSLENESKQVDTVTLLKPMPRPDIHKKDSADNHNQDYPNKHSNS